MSDITGRPLVKGYLGRISNGEMVDMFGFQYNPTETTRGRQVSYNDISPPGSPQPTANFVSIAGDVITLQLLLDAVEDYDPNKEGTGAMKAALEMFTQPDYAQFSDDIGQFVSPPVARYGMGDDSWEVRVDSVQFRDVRFNREGQATRTYVDIQMTAIFTDIATLRSRLDRLQNLRSRVVTDLSSGA